MKVVFRTDASLQIGSGHVMRCLTLADALAAQGVNCQFISRDHPGHLLEAIRQRGYKENSLVAPVNNVKFAIKSIVEDSPNLVQEPAHTAWLGSTWQTDAQETAAILSTLQPDWLVVDHYALDQRWESAMQPYCKKIMAIDDLADRAHHCDLLLDQNLGRQPQDYAALVPASCQVLTGPRYALLRPEFAALREYSLNRRANLQNPQIKNLLITMGGVDLPNATGQVLEILKTCPLPDDCRITVVMGTTAPALAQVRQLAAQMPWPTTVLVNVMDMAQHMADSDLAIGAAGGTSWERCSLGLPTLMVVLADNQRNIAAALDNAGAAVALDLTNHGRFVTQLQRAISRVSENGAHLSKLSLAAAGVTEGHGTDLIVAKIVGKSTP